MAKKEIFKKYIFLAVLAGIIGGVVGAGIEKTYDDLISNKLQSSISVRKDLGKEFNNNVFSCFISLYYIIVICMSIL